MSVNQFGFFPGRSTILLDDIGLNINNRQLTLATFIDFRKAFDTLDHNIILTRLAALKFHSSALKWFTSYLTNRKQKVLINNIRSNERNLSTGVPQGSVLGPLLFTIYVNSLANIDINSTILMYADDTIIYRAVDKTPSINELNEFQQDLDIVSTWCKDNKLSINAKKTKLMFLGTSRHIATYYSRKSTQFRPSL